MRSFKSVHALKVRALTVSIGLALTLCFSLSPNLTRGALAQTPQPQEEPPAQELKLPWEVSFGTTQLFENWFGQNDLNLPVSSATLMLAWAYHERLRAWVIFNLPLVPSQHLNSEGEARFSKNPPVVLLGLSAVLLNQKLRRQNRLEVDFGLYGGKVLEPNGLYFPVMAGRVSLIKKEDVSIYVGLSASVRVDTLGLIYGVGHRF